MRQHFPRTSLFFAVTAIIGYLSAPRFLGFSLIPLVLSLFFALLMGPKGWQKVFKELQEPLGRLRLKMISGIILSLALVLAAGHNFFPWNYDVAPGRTLGLSEHSIKLLKKIDKPVNIIVYMGPQDPRTPRIRELLRLYREASGGRVSFSFINPHTTAADDGTGPRVVASDSATIKAAGFSENISPVNESSINGAFNRLMIPANRMIYFISTFGEKMFQDKGPGGISRWAEDLNARRITTLDYYWADETFLPPEPSAIIIAGPKAPLGSWREEQLLKYIKKGGKVMVMADPFVVSFSEDFWRPFGIQYPDGLLIDPEVNMAGTSDVFIVSQSYPQHAITSAMGQRPILWPLAGAFQTATPPQGSTMNASVYALVLSSASSWLEKDGNSYVKKDTRYNAGEDIPGPLPLAVAAEIKSADKTGRLVAVADSDFAANSFYGFNGNREFCLASVNWLLDGAETYDVPSQPDAGQHFVFSYNSARLVFWLPVVVWPVLILSIWFFYRRRSRWQ